MRFRLLAATFALLALAGCGSNPTATKPSAAPSSSTVAATPSSESDADAVFDQYVQAQGLTSHGDIPLLESGAHSICASYANGVTFVQVISALTQNGWSGHEAGGMNGAAVAAYCPQYKDQTP